MGKDVKVMIKTKIRKLKWFRDVSIFCCFDIYINQFRKQFKKNIIIKQVYFCILIIETTFKNRKQTCPKTLPSLIVVHAFHLYEWNKKNVIVRYFL